MVHEVAGELTSGLGTALQTPDNPPGIALFINLHNTDGMLGVQDHITEELAGTGGEEILTGQVLAGNAHVDPGAGLLEEGAAGLHLLSLHAVGQIAAVTLVPALEPAVVAHTDIVLYDLYIQNAHNH